MKVLTVRHPWAWAIVNGGKDVENRPWGTKYRGPVAIHAGQQFDRNAPFPDELLAKTWADADFDYGYIIGVVDLVDSHMCFNSLTNFEGCSPWAQIDRRHLVLANPRPLSVSVKFTGALGLRDLPASVEREVRSRLSIHKQEGTEHADVP